MASVETRRAKGQLFAAPELRSLLTFQGARWRLWREDADERASEVTHHDTAEQYTTACWGGKADHRFALGTASGRVQVWDSRSGEAVGVKGEAFAAIISGADCGVSAIALSRRKRDSTFVSCFATAEILEVGISDGKTRMVIKGGKVGTVRLSVCGLGADEMLLSACPATTLRLWCVNPAEEGQSAKTPGCAKLTGPASAATCLDVCAAASKVLALCADGTPQVDVFVCDQSAVANAAKKAAPLPASFVLSGHEHIRSACFAPGVAEGRAVVVGWGPTAAAIWSFKYDRSGKAGRTVAASFVVLASELGSAVLSARPMLENAGSALTLACGSRASPAFFVARAPDVAGGSASIKPLESAAPAPPTLKGAASVAEATSAAKAKAKAQAKTPTVLGPLEATVATQRRRPAADMQGAEEEAATRKKRAKLLPEGTKAPAGLSIAPVVRQGLRSKDAQSIHKVLSTSDPKVIDSTVSELTGAEAFDLLQECSKRLLSQPLQGGELCNWINRVLARHCTYLYSQPLLHDALQPLHEALQARCASNRTLTRLHARMQILKNCGKSRLNDEKKVKSATEVSATAPLLEYCEGDEDDPSSDDEDSFSDAAGGKGCSDDESLDFEESDGDISLE